MAMDFFEHQEQARKQTAWLVGLFILAVAGIVVLVYLAAVIALWLYFGWQSSKTSAPPPTLVWWQPDVLFWSALATLAVVGIGTATKISQLKQGGGVVAEMMGGQQIDPDSADADEQKVLNVVEEMAIASGTAVPPVYVMQGEKGINAFAAGFTPDDAVVAVTRGTIEQLSRDELQGVIAHEFSHILNSDMRTNIRLMGVIHGIVVLSIIGLAMVRVMFYGAALGAGRHGHRGGDDRGGGGKAVIAIAAMGVALLIIGGVGAFFGKLIKAAVSRQREYLADAAAVQFTRNPEGLAGALKKIGGLKDGSRMRSARAEEASHMFFGQAFRSNLASLFATHPPLTNRIKRIEPSFQGQFEQAESATAGAGESAASGVSQLSGGASQAEAGAAADTSRPTDEAPGSGIGRIGQPTRAHLQYAGRLIRELPDALKQAAHEPYGARAVVYALVLDPDQTVRDHQWQRLKTSADPQVHKLTAKLAETIDALDPHARMPLLDMTVPALRELSPTQYKTFKQNLDALIEADDKIDLFEWMLQRTLSRYVAPERSKGDPNKVVHQRLSEVPEACGVLLSTLAYIGHSDQAGAEHAFEQARGELGLDQLSLCEPSDCGHQALDRALATLAGLAPRPKRSLLNGCAACVAADREATVREVELLRLVADSLGCPMPPVLPGQPLR